MSPRNSLPLSLNSSKQLAKMEQRNIQKVKAPGEKVNVKVLVFAIVLLT